jgi:hypothetical protein
VASMPATAEKKFTKTILIPGTTPRETKTKTKIKTTIGKIWTIGWIKSRLADRKVLALTLGVTLAILAGLVTIIAMHHRSGHRVPTHGAGGAPDGPGVR